MAAAHHIPQQPRYAFPPPPPAHSYSNERRLPSIKDLNIQYKSPANQDSTAGTPVESSSATQEHPRHPQSWSRPNSSANATPTMPSQHPHPQQQHTPPLSAGHEHSTPKVMDYTSKHDSGGYLTPGVPLSVQMAPNSGSMSTGPRSDDGTHPQQNPSKRARTASGSSISNPRHERPTHVSSLTVALLSCY